MSLLPNAKSDARYRVLVDAEESLQKVLQNQQEKSEILGVLVEHLSSNDDNVQLQATTMFRKLLSIEGVNPLFEEVIQSGVLPRFVEFLDRDDSPQLQFEAAWTLTNIAFGISENTKAVIDHGAVPLFVKLLRSPNKDVRDQAVWALGNIAGGSPAYRDLVLRHGALVPLLDQLNKVTRVSMLRNVTWTLSNLCRGEPKPDFKLVKPALPALERLILSSDEEVLADACWALSYLSDGTADKIQQVIDSGVCCRLVELLQHQSDLVLFPVIRTVGSIMAGDESQTQFMIDLGALPYFLALLTQNCKKSIKRESCWAISNITGGTKEQLHAVIETGLIAPLIDLLQNGESEIKKEAAWAITNAIARGTHTQVKYLVDQGCIKPLCDLLDFPNARTIKVCLKGLKNILKVGETEKKNLYAQMIDDYEGFEKIKSLQNHDNKKIRQSASKLIETYWPNNDKVENRSLILKSSKSFKF